MPAYHSMISYQCQALKCKKCTAWFPMRCGVFCGALLRPSLAFLLYNDSTVCLLLKFAVIPNLRAAFCEFFTMLSIISQVCANAQAQRQCLCAWFMYCYAANQFLPKILSKKFFMLLNDSWNHARIVSAVERVSPQSGQVFPLK